MAKRSSTAASRSARSFELCRVISTWLRFRCPIHQADRPDQPKSPSADTREHPLGRPSHHSPVERWGFRDAATFHAQSYSRPTAKRVSSTARFTLGDGFGQAYAVKRREIVIRGIEHKRAQLAASNADIAAGEKRQRHSVLKQTGERQFVAITVDAYNLHEIGNDPHRCFRSEHLGMDS